MATYARGKRWADAGKDVKEIWNTGIQPVDKKFELVADFQMTGDQPAAVARLVEGVNNGATKQTMLGVTGSGKTFTMANIVQQVQRPTLVMAHNKTLAAQLASEFKEFFPHNAVEYFVSYYDYYQPEAYVPQSDTYIEKDSSVNEELDKLRLSSTTSLLTRRDVLIVASVSCIYGLGDPNDYFNLVAQVKVGETRNRSQLVRQLVDMQYERNDMDLARAKFRIRGDTLELVPAYEEAAVRIQFFGDDVERIVQVDPLTGEVLADMAEVSIYPANHFVTSKEKMELAVVGIREELEWRLKELKDAGKILEAARLESRTHYDLEMLQETGFCSGVENYARHLSQRPPGSAPWTLLDYFPDDYLMFVDESHMTLPQVRGMYRGDMSRKTTLVDFGFRLPSALDNRPLNFDEYEKHINQVVYVSATPGPYELQNSRSVVQQVIRPTGLLDPTVEVKPTEGQIDDLLQQIRERIERAERILVTTLTKRMAEELADYLSEMGIRNTYLHSDIQTLDRIEILRDLRLGVYDVIVGINLLREGLDLPEVSLVAILDADKEGYLRSETSMVQTIGRAARHSNGHVIMYADRVTDSMRKAIDETNRRRTIQAAHNKQHGIEPQSIQKEVHDITEGIKAIAESRNRYNVVRKEMSRTDMFKVVKDLEVQMKESAKSLQFEKAAQFRDEIFELRRLLALEEKTIGPGDLMPEDAQAALEEELA
jgi:excinuclease ABC subunit B